MTAAGIIVLGIVAVAAVLALAPATGLTKMTLIVSIVAVVALLLALGTGRDIRLLWDTIEKMAARRDNDRRRARITALRRWRELANLRERVEKLEEQLGTEHRYTDS